MTEHVVVALPRECFVFYRKTVEHRSGKSRDLLQTGEFTSGDKVTHFCFCRDSFQCSCMRTFARLFLRVSSISARGSGRALSFFWALCLKTFHLSTVCVALGRRKQARSCCSGGGLSWCLRCFGSLFVFLSWSERQI